eukprot:SAG31_NODE_7332_length_1717_cov_1.289864_2_plen_136_part_00
MGGGAVGTGQKLLPMNFAQLLPGGGMHAAHPSEDMKVEFTTPFPDYRGRALETAAYSCIIFMTLRYLVEKITFAVWPGFSNLEPNQHRDWSMRITSTVTRSSAASEYPVRGNFGSDVCCAAEAHRLNAAVGPFDI